MDSPAVTHEQVLARLRNVFYDVVPTTYQTYCVVTAQISRKVLQHFKFDAELVPCQLWWAGPDGNYVVGFYKQEAGQWDGHVVCMSDGWLIDAGVHHIRKHLNTYIPNILVAKCFGIASNVISRFDLSERDRIWWFRPPQDLDIVVPLEPEDVVARYANELIGRIQADLAASGAAAPSESTVTTKSRH